MGKQPKRKIPRTWIYEDVLTGWRHLLILQPGYIKYVKRSANKWERRKAKSELRNSDNW